MQPDSITGRGTSGTSWPFLRDSSPVPPGLPGWPLRRRAACGTVSSVDNLHGPNVIRLLRLCRIAQPVKGPRIGITRVGNAEASGSSSEIWAVGIGCQGNAAAIFTTGGRFAGRMPVSHVRGYGRNLFRMSVWIVVSCGLRCRRGGREHLNGLPHDANVGGDVD